MAQNGEKKEFAIIGLGQFGLSVALTLMERGHQVLGVDIDPQLVQRYADEITHTVALDATDDNALQAVDIADFETVIVAIGNSFENSLMATVSLKGLGVKQVISKATTQRQAAILSRVGADRVVLPEEEAGSRLALELSASRLLDFFSIEPGFSIAEVPTPEPLHNHSLEETEIRQKYNLTVLVVKNDRGMLVSPPASYVFKEGDLLVVIGPDQDISRFLDMA